MLKKNCVVISLVCLMVLAGIISGEMQCHALEADPAKIVMATPEETETLIGLLDEGLIPQPIVKYLVGTYCKYSIEQVSTKNQFSQYLAARLSRMAALIERHFPERNIIGFAPKDQPFVVRIRNKANEVKDAAKSPIQKTFKSVVKDAVGYLKGVYSGSHGYSVLEVHSLMAPVEDKFDEVFPRPRQ